MWRVTGIETATTTLDFSSSGQANFDATAVFASGVQLSNAVQLVNVEPEATQVEVCSDCGCSGCSAGGWVSFRRLGEDLLWTPAWTFLRRGARERQEYAPPAFLQSRGAPLFGHASWDRMRQLLPALPAVSEVPLLDAHEAVRLSQLSAPLRVLHELPEVPQLRTELLLAVVEGDLRTEVDEVNRCARRYFESTRPVRSVEPDATFRRIEFLLDTPSAPTWSAFGRQGGQVFLVGESSRLLVVDEG